MKRAAAFALILIGTALPVCAQHGAAHGGGFHGGGGFSPHSAPAFHGGFGAPSRGVMPSRPAMGARPVVPGSLRPGSFVRRPSGPIGVRPGSGFPANRMRSFSGYGNRGISPTHGNRPEYSRDGHLRHPHRPRRPVYVSGFTYGFPYYGGPYYTGWLGPNYIGYPDDYGYDNGYDNSYQDNSNGYADNGSYPQPDDQGPPPPYEPPAEPAQQPAVPTSIPENPETVTLVFKDGRASEQIHNYILSRSTLSVLDGHHRDIPVDQLDLAATQKANRDAGVDFRLPDTLR